jgi:peptidyl-prolyl cis-trans isomerase C
MGMIRRFSVAMMALGALTLAACGGGKSDGDDMTLSEPTIAATVNGKPIYVEDVLAEAVAQGAIKEGEELEPTDPVFFQITEDLIETRLFAIEAEARGLDREPDVKHRLDIARERILANVLNENIADTALKDSAIERMYREQVKLLKQGQQVRISHILLDSKEAALGAKRRLEAGEQFVRLAYELSKDRSSGPDGGDLGFFNMDALPDGIRQAVNNTAVGKVSEPVKTTQGWHLIRVEEKRETAPPSLESMRPQIVRWLMFDEQRRVVEKLKRAAKIARLSKRPEEAAPGDVETGVDERPGLAQPDDGPAPPPAAVQRTPITPAPVSGLPRMGPGASASAPADEPKPKPQAAAPAPKPPTPKPAEPGDEGPVPLGPGERET